MARSVLFSFDTWFSVGKRRKLTGWLKHATTAWGAAIAAFVIYAAIEFIGPWKLASMFLCAMLTLVFLTVGGSLRANPVKPAIYDWVMSALSLVTGIYFFLQADRIAGRIQLMEELSSPDQFFGAALFFLTLEATRRTTGFGLTFVVLVFVAYNFLGHHFISPNL